MNHSTAARLCGLSYLNTTFENTDTDIQVYSLDLKGTRYIVIPGTHSLKDNLTNLKFRSLVTPYPDVYKGKVKLHAGYYQGYLSIRDQILELAQTDLPLLIAGHSSGGAIAQIAGVDVSFQREKPLRVADPLKKVSKKFNAPVETVTFGSPACGNKHWKESASKRIVNASYGNLFDFVPHLLPWNHHVSPIISNVNVYLNPHHIKNYAKSAKSRCGSATR